MSKSSENSKKFELDKSQSIEWHDITLYRIKACKSFVTAHGHTVYQGDIGGFVEDESNLSQDGSAWIDDNARVYNKALVSDDAFVCGNAEVYGKAKVSECAVVFEDALVYGNANVHGNTIVHGKSRVYDNANVFGSAGISGGAFVFGNAKVFGKSRIYDCALVFGNASIYDDVDVYDKATVCGDAEVGKDVEVCNSVYICDDARIKCNSDILYIKPIGPDDEFVTFFRSKNDKIRVSYGVKEYLMDDFIRLVSSWDDKYKSVAMLAVEMSKHCIRSIDSYSDNNTNT